MARYLAASVFLALAGLCVASASSGGGGSLRPAEEEPPTRLDLAGGGSHPVGRVSPSPLDKAFDNVSGKSASAGEHGADNTKSAIGRTKAARTYENLKSVYDNPPKNLRDVGDATARVFEIPTEAPISGLSELPSFIVRKFWTIVAMNVVGVLTSLFFTLFVLSVLAFLYTRFKDKVHDPIPLPIHADHNLALFDQGTWRYGVFECFAADKVICCVACFCPSIRWADTMRMAGIYSFWVGFLVFACLSYTTTASAGLTGLILLGVLTWKRQQLRQLFRMHSGGSSYAVDCCTYLFCACCAIVQEARQMEEAYAVKHSVISRIPHLLLHAGQVLPQMPTMHQVVGGVWPPQAGHPHPTTGATWHGHATLSPQGQPSPGVARGRPVVRHPQDGHPTTGTMRLA